MKPWRSQIKWALYFWIGGAFFTTLIYAQFKWYVWPRVFIISLLWNFNFVFLAIPLYRLTAVLSFEKIRKPFFFIIHFITGLVYSGLITLFAFLDLQLYPVAGLQRYLNEMYMQYFHICLISYVAIVSWFYFLHYVHKSKEQAIREAKLKQLAQESELKALKAQINPHFLFNTLNSINSLVMKDPEKTREMVTGLADTLRYVLDTSQRDMVTLGDEINCVKKYLAIEKIRFDEKLQLEYEIDEMLNHIPFPPIILQPIVENSIKHGICNKTSGGKISIITKKDNNKLICQIIDTGEGLNQNESSKAVKDGIGLKNIKERLRGIYKDSFTYSIRENNHVNPKKTITSIIIPLDYKR